MKLAALQDTMFHAVAGEAALAETAALVRGGALTPEDRVGIYAEMYWLRMRDSLRVDYPSTWQVLGDDGFDALVAAHLKRRPSTHYSLGRLGNGFAETIREAGHELPWLADLAALEWARDEAFLAPDAPVLVPAALSGLTDETFTRARLVLSPSVRLLHPAWNVLPVWRALEGSGPWRELGVGPASSPVVVWRQGFAVFHVSVERDEAVALVNAQNQLTLPGICEAFAQASEPVQAAFEALGSWVAEGMVSSLELDPA